MNTIIVIFDHRVSGTGPRIINLEDIRLILLSYTGPMLSAATVEKRVEERLRIHYDQVLDKAGHRVPARYVAETVMETARETGNVFWKDVASDVLVGPEVAQLLREFKSLKDVEALLREKHEWKF